MPPAGADEQFKFLISCIRYSNNGKVDFGQVANECGIVSKGAAAKRYERMMKAHGIAPNAAAVKTPASSPMRSSNTSRREDRSTNVKKRKHVFASDDRILDDAEEGFEPRTSQVKSEAEQLIIKEEAAQNAFADLDMNSFMPMGGMSMSDTTLGEMGSNSYDMNDYTNFAPYTPSSGVYSTQLNYSPQKFMGFGTYTGFEAANVLQQPSTPSHQQGGYETIVIGD